MLSTIEVNWSHLTYWTLVAMCRRKRKQMMKEVITQSGSTAVRKNIFVIVYIYIHIYIIRVAIFRAS